VVSRLFHTAVAQFWAHVRSFGICSGQSGTGAGFSEFFGFPCQFSFQWLLHTHHHSSYGAGTVGQTVVHIPSGMGLTPHQETKVNRYNKTFFHNYV
jgi:hypothetical protein